MELLTGCNAPFRRSTPNPWTSGRAPRLSNKFVLYCFKHFRSDLVQMNRLIVSHNSISKWPEWLINKGNYQYLMKLANPQISRLFCGDCDTFLSGRFSEPDSYRRPASGPQVSLSSKPFSRDPLSGSSAATNSGSLPSSWSVLPPPSWCLRASPPSMKPPQSSISIGKLPLASLARMPRAWRPMMLISSSPPRSKPSSPIPSCAPWPSASS
jgi:hypothetical protein